ncbi:hypothetical protein TKK_0018450 [Trichogramma kaykai]
MLGNNNNKRSQNSTPARKSDMNHNDVTSPKTPWGNPVDVPQEELSRYLQSRLDPEQQQQQQEQNNSGERTILVRSLNRPKRQRIDKQQQQQQTVKSQKRKAHRSRRRRRFEVAVGPAEGSYHQFVRSSPSSNGRATTTATTEERKKRSNTLKAVEKSGIVNTTIGVYEKNGLPTAASSSSHGNSGNNKRTKTLIGVPLVGMQPVLPMNGRIEVTMTRNNGKKRRAPPVPIAYPVKFTKNPYLASSAKNARDFHLIRESGVNNNNINNSSSSQTYPMFSMSSRSNSSMMLDASKRKTLYAKDADGDEAVRVLADLCLNPLANNNKRASFMMW